MNCTQHGNRIQYICTCQSCDYMPLCSQCRKDHLSSLNQASKNGDFKSEHLPYIVPLKKAIQTAEDNLRKQKKKIENLIQPFKSEKLILQDVEKQKRKLRQECERIKTQIQATFNAEIRELQMRNRQIYNRGGEDIPLEDLFNKIQEIQELQFSCKKNSKSLKKSIIYSLQKYLQSLGRSKSALTSTKFLHSNEYYLFDDVKHDFFLSRLQLKRKNVGGKPLTKIYNESPLYFLIDKQPKNNFTSINYDDSLYFFSNSERNLRIYDIKLHKWKTIVAPYDFKIPEFFCSVHDPQTDRFFVISGANSSTKLTNIFWYDRQMNQWKKSNRQLQVARSSAMCVLVAGKSGQDGHKILIAGGLDSRNKTIKNTQLYDINSDTVTSLSETNFGASTGTLVNFNNIIFKIGGLGNLNGEYTICQIIEKFDYGKYLDDSLTKWSYIQLEDVFGYKGTDYKLFYAAQAAIQINPNEIFVFGGYDHRNVGTQQSYILQVQTIRVKQQGSTKKLNPNLNSRYYARWINEKKLLTGEGFPVMKPVICGGKLYCLQNISVEGRNNQVLEKEKRVLEFNMYEWSETETYIDQ